MAKDKPKILCVDDEPEVLEGLTLHLRRHYTVHTATSGAEGLAILQSSEPICVVLSDMRMPEMNGATFLKHVRESSPNSVRMLLTGYTDIDSAVSAINDGWIFRFLTKPCPPETLLQAFDAAMQQYNLITAEKQLLEQTLRGSMRMLMDILSVIDPEFSGYSKRVREYVRAVAVAANAPSLWEIELGSMLAQIGIVTLPTQLRDRVSSGAPLTKQEEDVVLTVPEIGFRFISHIPRLEGVSRIVRYQSKFFDGTGTPEDSVQGKDIPIGARILRLTADLMQLERNGLSLVEAIQRLSKPQNIAKYDADLLDIAKKTLIPLSQRVQTLTVDYGGLRVGDWLKTNVNDSEGRLLLSAGSRISQADLVRLRHFRALVGITQEFQVERELT